MKFNKSKLPSRHVSVGVRSAGHRSMYYAMGLKKAPKQIVKKEKKALINYKIELKKLNSILNSIKN